MEEEKIERIDNKLKVGFLLNLAFTILEFLLGVLSGSLALISDAGHNLTDSLSLLIAFMANKISKRDANDEHSYGYGRTSILAALLNGFILFGLALYIFYEAFGRIVNPYHVQGIVVVVVAGIGILVNGSIALIFKKSQKDLNIKGAYLNMLFDTLASVGAVIAGLLILITGFSIFDSIISILIGILLIRASWGLIKSAVHVLLEGVPEGIEIDKVKEKILSLNPKIKNVDDLHIWAISSHNAALSCHVIIEDCTMEESVNIIEKIKEKLKESFAIKHATIETELRECPPE